MSESMAGVTFLAFGNGSPDVFSTFAAMSSHSGSLAVGELIGAAGFITAVVAGSMALVREFKVGKKTFVRDVGFFIVAASFSMIFLADGSLYLWECCAMIGFYLFYVGVVVIWHWYLNQQRKRRELHAAARGHYYIPGHEEIEVIEDDYEDEDAPANRGSRSSREQSVDNFGALERGISPSVEDDAGLDDAGSGDVRDVEGRQERRLAAEVASNMRVSRPTGARRNTITPIRPSLVGAMEFRSVLATLRKSLATHTRPIHLRRYSDDPVVTAKHTSIPSIPEFTRNLIDTSTDAAEETGRDVPLPRVRAVSMNDVAGSSATHPSVHKAANVLETGLVATRPPFPRYLEVPGASVSEAQSTTRSSLIDDGIPLSITVPSSPTISISPPSEYVSPEASPGIGLNNQEFDSMPAAPGLRTELFQRILRDQAHTRVEHLSSVQQSLPRLIIPPSRESGQLATPMSPFPLYTDSPASIQSSRPASLFLPEPEFDARPHSPLESEVEAPKPVRWWPYHVMPDPWVMIATLFPTLNTWRDKSITDKILSVVSTPSIFLLATTLPVVETESESEEGFDDGLYEPNLRGRRNNTMTPQLLSDRPFLDDEGTSEWERYRRSPLGHERHPSGSRSPVIHGLAGHGSTAEIAVATERSHEHYNPHNPSHHRSIEHAKQSLQVTASLSHPESASGKDWNRWLVIVQIFTAPLFVALIIWANNPKDDGSLDLKFLRNLVLYSLLGSLVVLIILLLTTTANKPPKYHFLLCFVGFVVSISWISTIANEVVGVLKAFGVILGISDAILGLTIFAVGNSLGDLVADITVARLGYPVMALSACFGGPMLNILLGIGISGVYMTMKDADRKHNKHPNQPVEYKPYQVELSGTLMISAITLLLTLVGLLVAVPWNKWIMSRRIGWGLIILWTIGTIINLIVEVTGAWNDTW